ncbi:MAG: hypothetical protein JNM22_01355 [Saprospiraceae bacterium]|nr:hypothetical protein [Saprospiraceae bacterium]
MQKLLLLFLLAGTVLVHTGCASWKQNRWLSEHRANLSRIANSNMPPEQKLDGLLTDYVEFMKQDLKFVDPVKGVKYVKKYHDQNEAAMDKILQEAEQWQSKLSLLDKGSLAIRVVQKPYIGSLIDLGPKFKRKYKQYAFAVKLAGKMTGGLTRFAGKAFD